MDFFEYFISFTVWIARGIGTLIGALLNVLFLGAVRSINGSTATGGKLTKAQKSEEAENQRLAGCRQVVLEYAEALGFIARECISRDELEQLIDNGIEPDALSREINHRIAEKPGIILGRYDFANGSVPIKLPNSLRDRHCYIIGRSGSGKTNLIRLMAMQDITSGHGIGMLAPEQELLTEEILPYIPEERIDDVVYFDPAQRN